MELVEGVRFKPTFSFCLPIGKGKVRSNTKGFVSISERDFLFLN